MPLLLEKGEEGGAQVTSYWNSCGGIGRKCAFYNGFAGSLPTAAGSPSFFALPTIVDKLQDDAKKIGGDNSYQINIGV